MEDEVEEGEIIEISDTEPISSHESDLEILEVLDIYSTAPSDIRSTTDNNTEEDEKKRRKYKSRRKPSQFIKNRRPLDRLSVKSVKRKKEIKNGGTVYDMDDYELLIARQKLIQQQLENISGSTSKDSTAKDEKKDVKTSHTRTSGSSSNNNNEPNNYSFQFSSIKKDEKTEVKTEDEDKEIEQLRTALLLQTSKSKMKTFKNDDNDHNHTKKEIDLIKNHERNAALSTMPVLKIKPILDSTSFPNKYVNGPALKKILKKRKNSHSVDDANLMYRKNVAGEKLSKNQRKKANKKMRDLLHASSSPSLNTRSKTSLQNEDLNDLINVTPNDIKKRQRGRRGGKRHKYLAERAQQKKELEIFQQQQQDVIYDNYTNVPMDLEDEDDNIIPPGGAPLPLIETLEQRPPPPPNDMFQPVYDQATLQMTSNNVAWMPGYVETLDSSLMLNQVQNQNTNIKAIQIDNNKENQSNETPVKDEPEEIDIWALRAQALKSLACKRAAKAKEKKPVVIKEKVVATATPIDTSALKLSLLSKTLSKIATSVTSPSVSGSSTPTLKTDYNRTNELFKSFAESPTHPPVIIQLTKEDFQSDDENNKKVKSIVINKNNTIAAKNNLPSKRSIIGDEHLVKELQNTTDRSSTRLKRISSFIIKDQIKYKKLQSQLVEKKDLFDEQNSVVKQLQEKLNDAIRARSVTKKLHNNIYSQIKGLKDSLKQKLEIRNKVNEESLRARSIVSVGKMNTTATFNDKVRNQLILLNKSIQQSNSDMLQLELKHGSTNGSIQKTSTAPPSTSTFDAQSALRKTAEEIKTMDKVALTKLESELKLKLLKYQQNNLPKSSSNVKSSSNEMSKEKATPIQIISMRSLPMVKMFEDLKKIKSIPSVSSDASTIKCSLLESFKQDTTSQIQEFKLNVECKKNKETTKTIDTNSLNNKEFCKYDSSLLCFKSYRLNPHFRTQSKLSLQSPTYTNKIDSRKIICKFDINGSCNDPKCSFWHYKDKCEMSANDIISELLSYDVTVFSASQQTSDTNKRKLLRFFITQFDQQYATKMSDDERILLIWNILKEARKQRNESESIAFVKRTWFYDQANPLLMQDVVKPTNSVYRMKKHVTKKKDDLAVTEYQEVRYFSEAYDSIEVLETAVADKPSDIKLWLTLAKKHLHRTADKKESKEGVTEENTIETEESNIENSLSVLSRALEANRDNEELWIQYLKLFSKTSSADDLRELCYQAVMYAATYNVWWTCLELESSYLGKQEICSEMLKFIVELETTKPSDKSHYLLETVLYVCHLLIDRGELITAVSIIAAALGSTEVADEKEKLQMKNISNLMTFGDRTLLWLCSISLQVFHHLPACLFEFENSCAGRLVFKDRFLFDWKLKRKQQSEVQIRSLFAAALENIGAENIDVLKSSLILYENIVSFEVYHGNTKDAVAIVQSLVKKEPSFVEGWVLLLSLYIHHSSMDTIVTVAEDCLHRCEHDVEVVYHYSNWLYKQGMPNLAIDKLTKCIHVYFEFEDESTIPDVLYLYKKVLGLPVPYNIGLTTYLPGMKASSQHLMFYYWISYCLLLKLRNIEPVVSTHLTATDEAFESAVHQYTSNANRKKLWLAFIQHRLEILRKQDQLSIQDYQNFIDLIFRCLMSVPARSVVTNNQSIHWIDYNFHNKVLNICMQYIPSEERSTVYRRAIVNMPDNVLLGERICQHELKEGNFEQARVICGFLLTEFPRCLPLWRMAIKVELQCNCIKEARWLYEESTKSLPLNESLWKDFALFEISVASDPEKLDDRLDVLIATAGDHGVSLRELIKKFQVNS